jgi:hypothetical protein
MNEGFDREFYRSRWQRVLPVGPYGVQPYVRVKRGSGRTGAGSALRRLRAMFAGMMAGAIASWRRGANGVAVRERRRYWSATPCP